MQLKPTAAAGAARVAGALALAVSSALGALGSARPVLASGDWTIDQATLFYSEAGRVTVLEPVVQLRHRLSGDREFGLRYTYDAMSGASPNGVSAASTPQTFTSPSGHRYTTGAVEFPTRTFRDWRQAVALDWTQPLWTRTKVQLGASGSAETDYRSMGLSATLTHELPARLTTLSAGGSVSFDRVTPSGGYNLPFSRYGTTSDDSWKDSDSKLLVDGLVGVSQVMNRAWVVDLNLGWGRDSGEMTDPYKGIAVIDGDGETLRAVHESRPDLRTRTTVDLRNRVHLGRDVLHLGARWYGDDWGVRATTLDLAYYWKPERLFDRRGWVIRPHLRWTDQSAADFFALSLLEGRDIQADNTPLVENASADFRLAAMQAWTVGLRVDLPPSDIGRFNFKVEHYLQSGDSFPAEAIGNQRNIDLYPELKVWMATVGWSWSF